MQASSRGRLHVMNKQLGALLDAEKEINDKIEELLRRKKTELEHTTQFMYRKNNYAPLYKLSLDVADKIERRKAKLYIAKKKYEDLHQIFSEKKSEFTVHKAEQRMRIEETNKQMEQLRTILRPDLRHMKNQLGNYSSDIINDKKRIGVLQEKLNHNINNVTMMKKALEETEAAIVMEEPRSLISKQRPEEVHLVLTNPQVRVPANYDIGNLQVNSEEYKGAPEDFIDLPIAEKSTKASKANMIYSGPDPKKCRFRMDLDKCSVKEAQLFEYLKPLLEGIVIFKKYKNKSSLKEKVYDPLFPQKNPPEACGYGKRMLLYNPTNTTLEFHGLKKPFTLEYSIPLNDLKTIIIPTDTQQIIRAQCKLNLLGSDSDRSLDVSQSVENPENEAEVEAKLDRLARTGDNNLFLEHCSKVKLYPFEILSQDSRLKAISEGYPTLKGIKSVIGKLVEDKLLTKGMSRRIQKA